MKRIKFGTDGWRAVIASEFTIENLNRLALATAKWVSQKYKNPKVVIGFDCRFGGKMFALSVAKVLGSKGINVLMAEEFTSTPAVSCSVVELKAQLGIMITASHNPPEYNGYKLKGEFGGPLNDDDLRDIENLIDYENQIDIDLIKTESLLEKGIIQYIQLDELYIDHVSKHFNIELLKKSASQLAFDPMFGSGQRILPAILPGIKAIHNQHEYSFKGTAPEPLEKNLQELKDLVGKNDKISLGLAVDGDADRIALVNEKGEYIDSHHIILLLMHYLAGYKKNKGIIVTGFSSSVKVEKLADHYRLPVIRVKIGFKQIAEHMLKEDVLVGGEESGGISVKGHLPERDGIWMGLLIYQWMLETGKSLTQLIQEIYDITGSFAFSRSDLQIEKERKQRILSLCLQGEFKEFGEFRVVKVEDLDGYKFYFKDDSWLMIRASGTEPVLRTYAEAPTKAGADRILQIAEEILRVC